MRPIADNTSSFYNAHMNGTHRKIYIIAPLILLISACNIPLAQMEPDLVTFAQRGNSVLTPEGGFQEQPKEENLVPRESPNEMPVTNEEEERQAVDTATKESQQTEAPTDTTTVQEGETATPTHTQAANPTNTQASNPTNTSPPPQPTNTNIPPPAPTATNTAPPPANPPPTATHTNPPPPPQPTNTFTHVPPTATHTQPPPPTHTSAPQPTNTTAPSNCSPSGNSSYESQVIAMINQERADEGLPALSSQSQLTSAARIHSADMACNDFFSHNSPTTGSPFDRIANQGYSYSWAGENIAAGYGSPASTVETWMNSSGHRANILNSNYVHIGIGYAYWGDSDYGSYWTAVFASP